MLISLMYFMSVCADVHQSPIRLGCCFLFRQFRPLPLMHISHSYYLLYIALPARALCFSMHAIVSKFSATTCARLHYNSHLPVIQSTAIHNSPTTVQFFRDVFLFARLPIPQSNFSDPIRDVFLFAGGGDSEGYQ